MKHFPLFLLTFLALLTAGAASAASFPKGSPKFQTDFAAAQKLSKSTGKPMVVVFSAPWCAACQVQKKKVYPSSTVKPFHDRFVWVYLNTDVKKNDAVANSYGVKKLPTIQFVNSAGRQLDKPVGVVDSRSFAKKLSGVLQKAK